MKAKKDASARRQEWWNKALGDDLVDARAFLPRDQYEKIRFLAEALGERIPLVIGKLCAAQLKLIERGKVEPPVPRSDETPLMADPDEIEKLLAAILASRFPDDNGATRTKHLAVVQAINILTKSGQRPTATSIARACDTHASQILRIAKVLEERGVILKVHMPSETVGKAGKVLLIQRSALEALNKTHIEQTGSPIEDLLLLAARTGA